MKGETVRSTSTAEDLDNPLPTIGRIDRKLTKMQKNSYTPSSNDLINQHLISIHSPLHSTAEYTFFSKGP
jgi:hypothetical protein